jgi:hypothetical protein
MFIINLFVYFWIGLIENTDLKFFHRLLRNMALVKLRLH